MTRRFFRSIGARFQLSRTVRKTFRDFSSLCLSFLVVGTAALPPAHPSVDRRDGRDMPRPVLRPPARARAVPDRHGAPARVFTRREEGVVHVEMDEATADAGGGYERERGGIGENSSETQSRHRETLRRRLPQVRLR